MIVKPGDMVIIQHRGANRAILVNGEEAATIPWNDTRGPHDIIAQDYMPPGCSSKLLPIPHSDEISFRIEEIARTKLL